MKRIPNTIEGMRKVAGEVETALHASLAVYKYTKFHVKREERGEFITISVCNDDCLAIQADLIERVQNVWSVYVKEYAGMMYYCASTTTRHIEESGITLTIPAMEITMTLI